MRRSSAFFVLVIAILTALVLIQYATHRSNFDVDYDAPRLKVQTKVIVGAMSNHEGSVITREGHVFKTSTHGKGAAVGSDMILEIEFVKLGSGVWKIYSSELKLSVKGLFEKG